jgi:hypothetical protein
MMKSWPCVVATGIALSGLAAARPASAGAVAPVCSGLIAEWKFEGNGSDTSNNGNSGTVFNPAYAPGVAGQALQLDGASTYAAFPDSPSLNPTTAMTISAWYFAAPFSGSGNDPIVDKGAPFHSPPYYQYHLGVSGTQYPVPGTVGATFALSAGGNTGGGTAPGTLVNGRWTHYVATYDGSESRFYADGVLIQSNPSTGTLATFGRPVMVGRFVNLPQFFLPGAVDEIRLFDRAVSPEEAELLYRSPDARPMVVPPAFNTCPGGTVTLTARHLATSGVTYKWRKNGQELGTETGPTLTIINATNDDAATYDCIVTTPCGEQTSLPATVSLCIGDLNADGQRNTADLTAFLGSFGQTVTPCSRGDLNADGIVNTLDLTTFLGRFGQPCQ